MTQIERIEKQIEALSGEEFATLRHWMDEYEAALWDRQFEQDVAAGKLDALAIRAQQDHRAGKTRRL